MHTSLGLPHRICLICSGLSILAMLFHVMCLSRAYDCSLFLFLGGVRISASVSIQFGVLAEGWGCSTSSGTQKAHNHKHFIGISLPYWGS